MTCTTCGRENPPQLTFCQECGQRLGPRIAPPTPPIGLPGQDMPPYGPPAVQPAPQQRPDPRAGTALGGVAPFPAPPNPIAVIAPPPPPQPVGAERRCRVCDTVNGANVRYCVSCGSTLDPQPVPSASPIAAAPVPSPSPIAPGRVVELGSTIVDQPRVCTRCRGVVDPGAAFCKFCGAPLADLQPPASPIGGTNVGQPMPAPTPTPPPPAPLLPHEKLELPRVNGSGERRPTVPMQEARSSLSVPTPHQAVQIPPQAVPPQAPAPPPPAPAPVVHGKLVVIAKSGADGPSYPIGDVMDIGRVEGNIVVGEDPYLAPRHVRLAFTAGKLVLRDLGTTNGVYLRLSTRRDMNNPRKPDPNAPGEVAIPLVDQDLILVGQQVMKFEVVKDPDGGAGPAAEHGTLLFGSPATPRYARLGQRTVEGVTRDVYYVRKMETVLGRESGDVVFTEDPFLSRRHAAIRILGRDGQPVPAGGKPSAGDLRFALVDLGSSNGTFIRLKGEIDLFSGDHFRVGQQLFRVDLTGGAG